MRELVACAVCAGKGWIEDCYPCDLSKEHTASTDAGDEQGEDVVGERDSESGAEEEDCDTRRGPLLRDGENYCYPGPAEKIHALLNVELYFL